MSSTDPMRDDSWILSETLRKTSLRPSHFLQLQNTKSSSLMRQITQPTMFNSSYGRLLRSLVATADSSSPATSKTKSSNHSTPDAPVLIFQPIPKDKPQLAAQVLQKTSRNLGCRKVLNMITKVLVELINKHFPDWRRVLNECQRYSSSGKIDSGILATFSDVKVNDLVKKLKEKDFPEVRKWVVNNLDNDTSVLSASYLRCLL